MKNVIIALLVVIIGVLGYVVFFQNDTQDTINDNTKSSTNSTEAKQPDSSGSETLDLSSRGLTELDPSIFDDSNVTTLDVSENNLTGALPAEIRKMSNLEVLHASDNNMTGIPAEMGQLSRLRIADFSNNDLSGLPLEIGDLPNLETLDLRGNPSISEYDISLIQPKIPNAEILTD